VGGKKQVDSNSYYAGVKHKKALEQRSNVVLTLGQEEGGRNDSNADATEKHPRTTVNKLTSGQLKTNRDKETDLKKSHGFAREKEKKRK